jgi:hypothetical protein
VPGDVHDVVDPAQEPEVAVLVDARTVAREVRARKAPPVRLDVALVVAIDAAQHGRPRPSEDQVAAAARPDLVALLVDDGGLDAGERLRG